jgi:hypothetical protein
LRRALESAGVRFIHEDEQDAFLILIVDPVEAEDDGDNGDDLPARQ